MFAYDRAQFDQLADDALAMARALGASDTAVGLSESFGLSVNVRKRKVETVEQNRDKGLSLTVYLGQRRGDATTSDFSRQAIEDTVRAAFDIARFTAEDAYAGLAEPDEFAREFPELDLFHPWELTTEQAIALALRCEGAALGTARAISDCEASVSTSQGHFLSANSRGFRGGYPYSRHSFGVGPIAKRGRAMQRDGWYSSERDASLLADPERVGRYAAERSLSRLGSRKLSTRRVPVLFEAPLAGGLLGSFSAAASGGSLYRKASFLLDAMGTDVFPSHLSITESPLLVGGMGSAPFDDDGVATRARRIVDHGRLEGWFLSCYSARKLGLKTTGNAGGEHNLAFVSDTTRPADDFAAMLRKMGTGLLVTELMGQGINTVTGDYSRGATGFWVEGGEIAYPVEEITIAGNLRDMFRGIVAVGSDVYVRGSRSTGSVLIDEMAVAGS